MPPAALRATVERYNSFVDTGVDADFKKPRPLYKIAKPPFYALAIMVVWHDSYGGLRVNGKHQVIDMRGEVIPGLYAGGEAVGGFQKHGLGKGHVHGFIAGTNAAAEPSPA